MQNKLPHYLSTSFLLIYINYIPFFFFSSICLLLHHHLGKHPKVQYWTQCLPQGVCAPPTMLRGRTAGFPKKNGWPGLQRGGVGGYHLHSPPRLWHINHEQSVSVWCLLLTSCCSSQTPSIHPSAKHFPFLFVQTLFLLCPFLFLPLSHYPFHSISTLITAWSLSITSPKSSILAPITFFRPLPSIHT